MKKEFSEILNERWKLHLEFGKEIGIKHRMDCVMKVSVSNAYAKRLGKHCCDCSIAKLLEGRREKLARLLALAWREGMNMLPKEHQTTSMPHVIHGIEEYSHVPLK